MKRKVTVQHNGADLEIELEGYLPEAEVESAYTPKAKVESLIREEKAKAKRSALAGALADEEFRTKALAQWGIDPNAKPGTGGGKLTDEQIAAMQKEIEAKKLNPLMEENATLKQSIASLHTKVLHKSILAAAQAAGVKPEYLTALPGGGAPAIISMAAPAFGYHDEHGEFYQKNRAGDGYEISPSKEAGRMYATVDDYFGTLAKDKEYARFFEKTTQQVGSGKPRLDGTQDQQVIPNDPMSIGANLEAIAKGTAMVAGT